LRCCGFTLEKGFAREQNLLHAKLKGVCEFAGCQWLREEVHSLDGGIRNRLPAQYLAGGTRGEFAWTYPGFASQLKPTAKQVSRDLRGVKVPNRRSLL
jgi:hypothetical protein